MSNKSTDLDVSVVVPVYSCDDSLESLFTRIRTVMEKLDLEFELILVDDRGPGRPWELITGLAAKDPRVRGIQLSRNFGQHYAITAGMDHCRGKWLVVMDCDLQDRPEEIEKLWRKAAEGYHVVIGRRTQRKDGLCKKFSSMLFHRLWGWMTDQESDPAQGNFGIYSSKVVEELRKMPETARMFPLLVRWLGFDAVGVDVAHNAGRGGSSYTWRKLLSLAADAVIAHSNKPLKLFIALGFAMSAFSFCFGVWIIISYFCFSGQTLTGWSSLMVSMYFLAGLILLGMGVLGVYTGRIFNQVKGRPLYVVSEYTPGPDESIPAQGADKRNP